MSRPDGKQDDLGAVVLDEPSAKQSDPTVLDLHLRAITKEANVKPVVSDFVCAIFSVLVYIHSQCLSKKQ